MKDLIDAQVCADTTYIVVGSPISEPFTDAYGKSCTSVENRFRRTQRRESAFDVLLPAAADQERKYEKSVMDCAASELKCAAFVLSHNMLKRTRAAGQKDMMSVAEIERLTGFYLFANVPNAPKDTYNPSDWGL